ncbi:MAG: hypothetical protein ACTHJH_09105 [Marmoricola sp.]
MTAAPLAPAAVPPAPRLPYDDADTAFQMAHDADACRAEAHLAAALLRAPGAVSRTAVLGALTVSDQAALFAGRFLD